MPVCFITGATKNTGYAIAEKFAENGYAIAISSRKEEDAQAAAQRLKEKYGVESKGYGLDLTSVSDICRVFKKIKADFCRLDTFVANSAHLGVGNKLLTATEEEFDALMDVNLKGNYFCCQQAALLMKENGGGAMVFISSVHSKKPANRSLYSTSKAGINALASAAALELAHLNIRVNTILAGAIRTERWDDLTEEEIAQKRKNWPLGVESTGEDIANGVFYLGTPLSKTVTGAEITIDSGVLLNLLPYNGGENK